MMKKVTVKQLMLLSLFMAMAWSASAQMKVGENPNTINKGSVLELEAKDKGVLYPRVALTASNAWLPLQGTAVAGMTVYNTATVTATTSATTSLSPGFYFWEGAKWNKIATESKVEAGVEWKDGTVSGTNLIYANQAKTAGNDVVVTDEGFIGLGTKKPTSPIEIVSEYKGIQLSHGNDLHYTYYDGSSSSIGDPITLFYKRVGGTKEAPANLRNGVTLFEQFMTGYVNNNEVLLTRLSSTYKGDGTTVLSDLAIGVSNSSSDIYIKENHNVGIGTTTPTERLEVDGNVSVGKYIDGRETGTNVEGAKLFFNGLAYNTDIMYMQKYNVAADRTELRVGLGDNAGGDDKFVIGSHVDIKNYQWTPLFTVVNNGNIGVGTATPTQKLEVAGKVKATGFMAGTTNLSVPDYVFESYYNGSSELNNEYSFMSLPDIEAFTKANNHLPGYESAATIAEEGSLNIVDTQLKNVEKIEELYLHTIEQEKRIATQQKEIEELKIQATKVEQLEKLVRQLLKK